MFCQLGTLTAQPIMVLLQHDILQSPAARPTCTSGESFKPNQVVPYDVVVYKVLQEGPSTDKLSKLQQIFEGNNGTEATSTL